MPDFAAGAQRVQPASRLVLADRSLWLQRLALVALGCHAFFAMAGIGRWVKHESAAMALLLLIGFAWRRAWRELKSDPVVGLVLVLIAYALLHGLYCAYAVSGASLSDQLSESAELARVGVFTVVVGWWLSWRPQAMRWLLGLMALGFLFAMLWRLPGLHLADVIQGTQRLRLEYSENIVGEFSAIALLTTCVFLSVPMSSSSRWMAAMRKAGLVCLSIVFCLALVWSQSRGAWLAAMIAVPVAVFGMLYGRGCLRLTSTAWRSLLLVVSAGLLLWLCAGDLIAVRFSALRDLGALDHAHPLHSPIAIRAELYKLGIDTWSAHPIFGIGLANIAPLIEARAQAIGMEPHTHLHNSYLQALVGLGTLGAALLAVIAALLLRSLAQARRMQLIDATVAWMLIGILTIVLVVNLFDSLLWRFDYLRAPLELVFGCLFACGLQVRRRIAADARAVTSRA